MKANPYEASSIEHASSVGGQPRLLWLILRIWFSLLLGMTPSAIAVWAWREAWRRQQPEAGVNSFPMEAFASQMTILSVVSWVCVGSVWLIVVLWRRRKGRQADRATESGSLGS